MVLKFPLGTRFATSYWLTHLRTHIHTDKHFDHNTLSQFYIKYISYKWRWKYGNIISIVNILIFRVSNYNLLPFHFHIFPYFLNNIEYKKKNSPSLKMRNFHWKIQKFKNPFFIILISFSINFKQFFFVFHTFFTISHLFFTPFSTFFCHCTTP